MRRKRESFKAARRNRIIGGRDDRGRGGDKAMARVRGMPRALPSGRSLRAEN